MTIPGNLPPNSIAQNSTTAYFETGNTPRISANTNDAVVGYFQQLTGDAQTGETLAAAVISTAQQQNINPMDVIEQLNALSQANGQTSPTYANYVTPNGGDQYAKPGPSTPYINISQVNSFLTMFLNLNRANTSLLGLSNSPQTSPFITRAILA